MEFWGVEVKPGQPLKVVPEYNKLIHISQAALDEVKNVKGSESVPLRLKVDSGKFVIGTLAAANDPQLMFDLVFEKEFELSHDWKNGSVYFCGYTADNPDAGDEEDLELHSDEDDDIPVGIPENGKLQPKPVQNKAIAAKPESSTKPKVRLVEPKKDEDSDEDDDDADSEESDDNSDDVGSEDDILDESDSDEEIPKKAEPIKKRPSESATKTPVPSKKAKFATPQKTDGKKGGGQTATPHPSKQAGKIPATTSNKSKEKTPKSGTQFSCNSCSKTFNSEVGLQSHTKDKHSGK